MRKFNWWLQHKDDVPTATNCLLDQKTQTHDIEEPLEQKPCNITEQKHEKQPNKNEQGQEQKPKSSTNTEDNTPIRNDDNSVPAEEKPQNQTEGTEHEPQGATAAVCCNPETFRLPDYPLFPLSKGFQKSLESCLKQLKDAMVKSGLGACLAKDE